MTLAAGSYQFPAGHRDR